MIGEISFYGIFVPWLLLLALITLPISWCIRRIFAACGGYRWVWHPALFDLALYAVLLYVVCMVSRYFQ